jgi:hypothetical protein
MKRYSKAFKFIPFPILFSYHKEEPRRGMGNRRDFYSCMTKHFTGEHRIE